MITTYKISDLDDFESFLNNLFVGFSFYKKRNPHMMFKISWTKDTIILKTYYRDGSAN